MQVDDAVAMLADDDIEVERSLVDEAGADAGTVLEQTPGAGTEADLVTLSVASGKVLLAEEDVVGEPVEVATADLTEMGLEVTVDRRATSEAEPGTVTAVDRSGRVAVGSTVQLTVATAPPVVAPVVTAPSAGSSAGSSAPKASSGSGKGPSKAKGGKGRKK